MNLTGADLRGATGLQGSKLADPRLLDTRIDHGSRPGDWAARV